MRRNRDFSNIKPMSGPLMTSHLRDLDMELELLKRKREIIQQEQNMLSRLSRQNNYEQPSNSYNRHDHDQYEPQQVNVSNFANLYDGPGGSRGFRQQGFKRPPQSQWQAPNPPKRFNAPRAMNPWQNDNINEQAQSRKAYPPSSKPRFSQPVPLMSLKPGIGQRIRKDNRHQTRRDFQPNKVTKPNVQPAKSMKPKDFQPRPKPKPKSKSGPVAKLATCTPPEAKKLVSETMKAIEPQVDDQILYADRQPSLQMKGRMELALGSILKEMRQEYCTDPDASEYFVTQFIQRIIKQTIRLRIRDVMMGKVIGAVSDILENYRKTYPKETDIEILNIVKDAQTYSSKNLSVTHLIESDDPLDFFRKNMQRVLSIKLENLFSSLQNFYENRDGQVVEGIKVLIEGINKLPDPEALDQKNDESKEEEKKTISNEKSNLYQIINNFFDSVPSNNEFVQALGGRLDKAKYYVDFMDKLIEERLPRVLPKFKDVILNILYTDKEFFGTKAMIMTEMKKKVKDIVSDDTVEPKVSEVLKKVDYNKKYDSEVSQDKKDEEKSKTNEPSNEEKVKEENKPDNPSQEEVAAADKTSIKPDQETLYYIKLLGRPKLPARPVLYEFLNQFSPKSVRKHKTIQCLLVVTFNNEENYKKLLEANETVVGDATLILKAGQALPGNKEISPEFYGAQQNSDQKLSNTLAEENIICSDLDNQISDLLSSIRKTEETNGIEKSTEESTSEVNDKVDEMHDTSMATNDINEIIDKVDETTVIVEGRTNKETDNKEVTETGVRRTSEDDKCDVETLEKIDDFLRDHQDEEANKEVLMENESDKIQKVEDKTNVKESGRSTPTRTSSRLPSTPCSVRTRRANRLAQNNTEKNV